MKTCRHTLQPHLQSHNTVWVVGLCCREQRVGLLGRLSDVPGHCATLCAHHHDLSEVDGGAEVDQRRHRFWGLVGGRCGRLGTVKRVKCVWCGRKWILKCPPSLPYFTSKLFSLPHMAIISVPQHCSPSLPHSAIFHLKTTFPPSLIWPHCTRHCPPSLIWPNTYLHTADV